MSRDTLRADTTLHDALTRAIEQAGYLPSEAEARVRAWCEHWLFQEYSWSHGSVDSIARAAVRAYRDAHPATAATPGRAIPCVEGLHDACTRRGLPCSCACHPLAEAAARASASGVTYTAALAADRTVGVQRVVAGVVTELRFGDVHEALGFLDAERGRSC